ncbi:ABC transporter permease [Patulibacter minatonensis]|uniref:ABC transporter permease n=1 Tax=Patulibacter minatonensis TaxID=298163 RepID=UPI0004B8C489|nr:ABC transporter permease [Patulibacter minatonensis]
MTRLLAPVVRLLARLLAPVAALWDRFARTLPGRVVVRVFGPTVRRLVSPTARYIYRRLVWMVFLLLVVSMLAFLIFYALPSGDPAAQRAGKGADQAQIDRVKHTLFLDRPIYEQYFHYIKQIVLHFDFGFSYDTNADVAHAITSRLPATISLAAGAAVIWLIVGVLIGILSALRPRSFFDRLVMGGALLGISAPVYWLALVALALFSQSYGVIHLIPDTGAYRPLTEDPGAWFTSLIVPWCILALSFAAIYARLMRANLLEVLDQDYLRTAEAKGLSRRRVVVRHGVRSAITPIVTAFGLDLGILLGGAVLTESVFNIPGIGRLSYDAIVASNLPVIQGTVLFAAFFIIAANILVDIVYALIDPRVRLA